MSDWFTSDRRLRCTATITAFRENRSKLVFAVRSALLRLRCSVVIGPGTVSASLLTVVISLLLAPDIRGLLGAGLALTVIGIAAADAREFIIPDSLCGLALALGVLHASVATPSSVAEGIATACLRGGLLAFLFFALKNGYRILRGREGIGWGDVKLAGVGGVWLDLSTIPIAIEIASAGALISYLVVHFARRRRQPTRLTYRLPFGLFLAPAIWFGWLFQVLTAI
jgi:leader peptidase (prepilin peptidase)/N-methyltransferase